MTSGSLHIQHDSRWFTAWAGLSLRHWGIGFIAKQDDDRSVAIFVGPLYAGIGGYDR